MPRFEVITPLRNGGDEPIAPGEIVELPEKEGAALAAIGAVKRLAGDGKATSKPAAPQTAPQLVKLGKTKLVALAADEKVAIAANATAAEMADAIVAARAVKAAVTDAVASGQL